MEICYHLEPGIWAVRRIKRQLSLFSENRSRLQFLPGQVVFIRETTGSTFHSWGLVQEKGWKFAVLLMHHYSWHTLYPLALNVYWWGVGGGGTVKTVCMSIVFCRANDRVGRYLYYVFCVRVKLNSWHRNIEALKKQKNKKTWDVYLNFLNCWY